MLRIAVTTIEAFKNYIEGSAELTDLMDKIQGKFVPTKYMELGKAFHDVLEKSNERYVPSEHIYRAKNGIEFTEELILKCLQAINPAASFEVKMSKIYNINNRPVEVVGKVDQILGNYIYENKTCWSVFDYEKYNRSCQWLFYLDIFEAERVYYNVFCLEDRNSGIELRNIEQFYFSPYPDLIVDINSLLLQFVEFIYSQKLESFFSN